MDKTLLVIDDEPEILEMIYNHFSLRGYEVLKAQDGKEGLDLIKKYKPQVVILDIKMKGIDGDKVLEIIKKDYPFIKTIIVTAYQNEVTRQKVLSLGPEAYFDKPVSIIELQRKVEELLVEADKR